MKRIICNWNTLVLWVVLGVLTGEGVARGDTPLTAAEIIRRTVERSETAEEREAASNYQFRKRTVTEELDGKGRVTTRKEKLYDVLVQAGQSKEKLVEVNGKALPPRELKKQADHDAAERAKYSKEKPAKKHKGQPKEKLATEELTARYHFTRLADETVNGRVTLVLAFEPKSGKLPEHELTDRFLNQMEGKVWIDAEEFELARADIHLRAEITLWGGVLGKLRRCEFSFSQMREADGIWVEAASNGVFEGRKLLESMTIKSKTEVSDFRPLSATPEP